MTKKSQDVEASTFALPEWDFKNPDVRAEFIQLRREVSPDFVWLAPPCRKWSAMQRLNRRTPEQRTALQEARQEEAHLNLVSDVSEVSKEIDSSYAMEHPHGAESWESSAMQNMKGYYEGVCIDVRLVPTIVTSIKKDQFENRLVSEQVAGG